MEQHPIPQQISSYQFRLVGDMTLKQFFQLAGGIMVGLLFYSMPVIAIVKLPLAFISVLLGIGLAFVPLEERPLEKWIFTFFRAIYAPTQFYWKKSLQPHKYFQDEPNQEAPATPQEKALQDYLGSPAQKTGPLAKLESAEKGFLSALSGMFNMGFTKPHPAPTPTPPTTPTPAIPVGTTLIGEQKTPPGPVQASQAPKDIAVPQTPQIKVVSNIPHLVVEERPKAPVANETPIQTQQVAPIIAGEEIVSTKQAMYSIDAAPPNPPTTPNVVVGQVVDETRRIVEGAIMEIRDSYGRPIRALRSNKAGHFMTVTPLENGGYDVVTEKDGYEFTAVHFEASGGLIPPILVQGKRNHVPESPPIEPNSTQQPNQFRAQVQQI